MSAIRDEDHNAKANVEPNTEPITGAVVLPSPSSTLSPAEQVFHIDLVMKKIIKHVVHLKSRATLELTCRRMYHLSRSSKFKFPLESDYLRLIFRCWHTSILTVALGTLEFNQECLSFSARRDNGNTNRQPESLMTLIKNLVERVGPRAIRRLQIGGITPEDASRGVRNHMLVCTADLVQLAENLPNLRSVNFENLHFDDGAVDFILSEKCTFHKRLENIVFNKVTFDARHVAAEMLKRLFTPALKKFSLNTFAVTSQGNGFLDALDMMDHKLEELNIYIDEDAFGSEVDVDAGKTFMRRCSERAKDLKVHFWHMHKAHNIKLFAVARDICKLSNITELNLNVCAFEDEAVNSVAFVCKNIGLMNLRSFSIGGFRSSRAREDTVIKCLISGMKRCQNLRKFHLARVPKRDHLFMKLLEVLPTTIVDLEFEIAPFTDEMIIGAIDRLPGLRHLSLKQMSRLTPQIVYIAMRHRPELITFASEILCSMPALHLFTDHASHPKLRHAEFCVTSALSESQLQMLRQYFRGVIVDHILLSPKGKKGYLVQCDWQIPTAPPPSEELEGLYLINLKPMVKHERKGRRIWGEDEWKPGWK